MTSTLKNKKSEELDVFKVFEPVLILSGMAGVSTLSIRRIVQFSWKITTFTSITSILILIHTFLIPNAVIYVERKAQDNTPGINLNTTDLTMTSQQFITKLANPLIVSVIAVGIRATILLRMHKLLPYILETLCKIDKMLRVNDSCYKTDMLYLRASTVIVILISWPFQVYSDFSFLSENFVSMILFAVNLYNCFTAVCVELQFISVCWLLYNRFEIINGRMLQIEKFLINQKIPKNGIDLLSPPLEEVSKFVKLMPLQQENIKNEVVALRSCHRSLNEMCTILNNLYNVPLLLCLTGSAINVMLNLYYAIYGGFDSPSTTDVATQSALEIFNNVIWGLFYLKQFAAVCIAADAVTTEANKCKSLVSNTLDVHLNQHLKEELWIFLGYTLSNEVRFSACGFFNISFTLITTAVSTGATYLVILAQFHKAENV